MKFNNSAINSIDEPISPQITDDFSLIVLLLD